MARGSTCQQVIAVDCCKQIALLVKHSSCIPPKRESLTMRSLPAGVIGEQDIAVDAFAGWGGNTVALASTCQHVIAVDCSEQNAGVVWHNAGVYGVSERVHVVCSDFFAVAPHLHVRALAVRVEQCARLCG